MSLRMISIEKHGIVAFRTHAFLDGVELVGCCVAADPIEGWADCYEQDETGKVKFAGVGMRPKIERRFGSVRLECVE